MTTFALVRSEHLNHQGYLFGGALLKWVDEFAWLTAARDFPGSTLVTRAMDKIEFRTHVLNGSILRFEIVPEKQGNSSIQYSVIIYANEPGSDMEIEVFVTNITFVSVDAAGKKKELPKKGQLRSLK